MHIYTKRGTQGSVYSKVGMEAVRVGDMGRDMIRRGQNSDTEFMEGGVSGMMGKGEIGWSRIGPELTWCYDHNSTPLLD